MKHFIGKQLFELTLPSTDEAWKKQEQLSRLYWERVILVLEKVFDRLVEENTMIRIEKLTIDLGFISAQDLENGAFIDKLERMLEEKIRLIVHKPSSKTLIVPYLESEFEKWIYFLEFGHIPWSVSLPGSNWYRSVLDTLASQITAINTLQILLQKQAVSRERLVRQHQQDFLKTVIELFTARKQDLLLFFLEEWERLIKLGLGQIVIPSIFHKKEAFWLDVLARLLPRRPHLMPEEIIRQYLKNALTNLSSYDNIQDIVNADDFPVINKIISNYGPDKIAKKNIESHSDDLTEHNKPLVKKEPSNSKKSISKGKKESSTKDEQPRERSFEKSSKEEMCNSDKIRDQKIYHKYSQEIIVGNHIKEGEALYVQNAGVVLMHPFLSSFFKKLTLIEENRFSDNHCQHRAIHLIHYLATGKLGVPEYGLVLPKLLCGLAPNIPLDHSIILNDDFLDEANSLLEAAIDHWGVLGKTSPDGLREGFLQREGKLEKLSTGLQLTVEKKSIDILLDQLPWNLGIVKLPWMPELLRVDWR